MYLTRLTQTFCITFFFFLFMHFASADQTQKDDLWDDVDAQSTVQTSKPAAPEAKPENKPQFAEPDIQMWTIAKARDMYREQPPEETFLDFRQGSVDFWVKYDPAWQAKDESGTIVALSNGYDTLFEFSMSAEGDAIYMENSEDDALTGAKSRRNAVNFDFKDDLIHHVALVTDGKLTKMHVDGRLVGQFSLGYAIPTDAQGQRDDLQLSIGSLDGRKNKFQGQVGAIRIWGIPLDANLLLKAAFMRDDELLNQAWAKSFLIAYLGNEAGQKSKPSLNVMPESFRRPEGVWMANNQKERKQKAKSSFSEQFKSVDGVPLNYEYEPQAYTQILVVPRDSELARFANTNNSQAASSNNQASTGNADMAGYSKMVGKFMKGVAMAPAMPKTLNECANTCSSSTKCTHFNYIGNTCYLISEEITLQSFPTNSVLYTKIAKPTQQAKVADTQRETQPDLGDLESPLAVEKPRKTITDKELPVIVALSFDPVKGVNNQIKVEAYEATSERNNYKSTAGVIHVNGATSLSKNNEHYERTSSLGLPKKTDANVDDVFIVANQIRNKKTVLYGYDPLKLDPFTLGDPGIKKQIFEHTKYGFNNGANRVVPLGLELIDIQSGSGRVKTREAMSQSSIQEMLGGSVSASFDINTPKGGGSMSANANFKTITDTSQGQEKGYTFAQSHQTRFIVLVDKSKIGLSQNFKDAVLLAAKSPSPASAQKLVEDYGTHYAHAVAMGGRIIQMLEFSKEEWGQGKIYEGGLGLAVEARIGPKEVGVTAKGAVGVDASSTAKFESKVSSSNDKWQYQGGQGTGLTGWSVTDETTTPIFLDLRVLSEVLAPPFFTDPKVFNTLRPLVYQEILAYVKRNRGPLSTANLVPKELVVGSTLILEKKSCGYDDTNWRVENNTDSKFEGGGVWARFQLPKREHNQVVSYKAGCIAHSHFDGPIDAALECNRVCWENTQMICDDGTWKNQYNKKPEQVFTKDLLCHGTGVQEQDNFGASTGNSPWRAEESRKAYLKAIEPICKALPKGMAGRPADCP